MHSSKNVCVKFDSVETNYPALFDPERKAGSFQQYLY